MSVDVERFRELLLTERKRLEGAIEYLHAENPGGLADDEAEEARLDNHLAETASVTVDREIDYTLEENAEHTLREIDDALKRIDEGTFGTCRTCGRPIGEERLEAIPWATQCIDCRRRDERG